MNSCCKKAKKYLKNIDDCDHNHLIEFINEFNIKIKDYSNNGISTYLLECIEVCLELSKSIDYLRGEALTRWLKGHVLFLGGQYSLSLDSYKRSMKLIDVNDSGYDDICRSYAYNLYCIGNLSKSLESITPIIKSGDTTKINTLLSGILKCRGEDELSYSVMGRVDSLDFFEGIEKVHSLLCLNKVEDAEKILDSIKPLLPENDTFFEAYLATLNARLELYRDNSADVEDLENLISALSSKKSFYHYVDGLLNIAELFIAAGKVDDAREVLQKIEGDKRDLKALDCRLYKLMEKTCLECQDFKGAYDNNIIFSNIIKERNSFDVDKSLRFLSTYLYKGEALTSI